MGVISPLGHTARTSWTNLIEGNSGIGLITQFDPFRIPARIAGEVKDFDPANYMSVKEARRISRSSQFAVAATRMAMEDSGLTMPITGNAERVGTIIGTGAGGLEVVDRELDVLRTQGFSRVSPFALTGFLPNMPSHHVSVVAGAKGPITTTVAACASGTQAIGYGADLISLGRADMVVAGGVEGLIHETSVAAFARLGALAVRDDDPARACRPFDLERNGTVLSEGAGILVLERLDHALDRGATVYAEVLGHGSSADAFHAVAPDPEAAGMTRAMRWAMEDAGIGPECVDYINAHGTATVANDAMETLAIKQVFGERAYTIPVSSSKAVLGHVLGAAGAIEAIMCVYAMNYGLIPPTWHLDNPDPACDLDFVPNGPRPAELNIVLSNSFAMGGQNASLVLGKFGQNGNGSAAH
jgi:beta-ketoacyl-acyl-carrier-protein synthase II